MSHSACVRASIPENSAVTGTAARCTVRLILSCQISRLWPLSHPSSRPKGEGANALERISETQTACDDTETLTNKYGHFWAQPFERGFGTTIGNALRRVLLVFH